MKRWALLLFALWGIPAAAQVYVPPVDTSTLVTQSQLNAAAATNLAAMQAASLAAGYITAAQAPVQSVNTKTGNPVIPTLCRQQSAALSIPSTNPGSVTYTFPNTTCSFAAPPSCWADVSMTSTSFVLDFPLNTARSASGVTYSFTAHASVLTIALGTLSLTVEPPAGSTVVLTCTAMPV